MQSRNDPASMERKGSINESKESRDLSQNCRLAAGLWVRCSSLMAEIRRNPKYLLCLRRCSAKSSLQGYSCGRVVTEGASAGTGETSGALGQWDTRFPGHAAPWRVSAEGKGLTKPQCF